VYRKLATAIMNCEESVVPIPMEDARLRELIRV